ncbi:unnamed protein product [Bursaphelenchus okinawaensis]|uniref:Uncharacterized protein n=1 Tax=Bursaphelenchus okinawaensis TaxID=465554 RepID=A0A811KF64_9BILA|nr:unnamed protein product [Bursaphelenchus okinawaensis]CAG9102790.1 unnamed protein product [Bursaphelenchus okinawaensis]
MVLKRKLSAVEESDGVASIELSNRVFSRSTMTDVLTSTPKKRKCSADLSSTFDFSNDLFFDDTGIQKTLNKRAAQAFMDMYLYSEEYETLEGGIDISRAKRLSLVSKKFRKEIQKMHAKSVWELYFDEDGVILFSDMGGIMRDTEFHNLTIADISSLHLFLPKQLEFTLSFSLWSAVDLKPNEIQEIGRILKENFTGSFSFVLESDMDEFGVMALTIPMFHTIKQRVRTVFCQPNFISHLDGCSLHTLTLNSYENMYLEPLKNACVHHLVFNEQYGFETLYSIDSPLICVKTVSFEYCYFDDYVMPFDEVFSQICTKFPNLKVLKIVACGDPDVHDDEVAVLRKSVLRLTSLFGVLAIQAAEHHINVSINATIEVVDDEHLKEKVKIFEDFLGPFQEWTESYCFHTNVRHCRMNLKLKKDQSVQLV